jgi:hypothetical protein
MLLCAAQLDQQVQAQRGARPAQAHTYEPPHRADTSRPQEQSRNSQHDQFTPHQTDHNSEARDGSNERATFDLFGNRLHEALAEILQRAAILEASIRVRVSNHLCCDFSRPSKTSYDDVYRKAEEKIRSTYFDMPFHSEAHRFVFTTDDTIILRMLDNSKLPHFEKATGATNWSSLQNIQNRLSELRRQLGDGGRVIMVGLNRHDHCRHS